MPSPTIILTGHRGFIGSALKEVLQDQFPGDLLAVTCDLRDAHQVADELGQIENDSVTVVHLATVNRCDCLTYEGYSANCAMLMNLIRATDRFSSRNFLFASSTDVFGAPASLPLTESSPHQPQDWYALSKSIGEWILHQTKVDHAVFRLPGVFGARANERSLLRRLFQQGIEVGSVRLTSQGQVLRDFVYLEDLIALFQEWIALPRSGVWNVASGEASSLEITLTELRSLANVAFEIDLQTEKSPRDFNLVFDSSHLQQSFPSARIRPAIRVLKDYLAATLRNAVAA